MDKRLKNLLIFFSLFLILNLIFFYFYHKALGLQLPFSAAIILILFAIDYFLILHIIKFNILRKILIFTFWIIFTSYCLINFGYYKVFQSFWHFSAAQIGELNAPRIKLLTDYFNLAPLYIYYLIGVFLLLAVFISFLYIKKIKKLNFSLESALKNDFINKKIRSKFSVWILLGAFVFTNLIIIIFLNFSKKKIGENFSRAKYYSNLTVYGYLFDEIKNYTMGGIRNIYSKEKMVSNFKSDIENVKKGLEDLALLNSASAEEKIELAGFDKPNIIIYQMESVGAWALKQKPSPMPFLKNLIENNISANHFFSNSCTTINAEFSAVCSFYPESSGPISDLFSYNDYYCLPQILKDRYGYESSFFHANSGNFWNRDVLNERWGYENNYFAPVYKIRDYDGVILSDVVERMTKSEKPSFNYIAGFTSHSPHDQEFVDFSYYANNVKINSYQYELNDNSLTAKIDEETIKIYFGFLTAVDDAIKLLFDKLEQENLLDNTIVVIFGDHRYYPFNSSDKIKDFYNYNEIPFVMHIPGKYKGMAKEIASQIDIAPTLLHIIEGDNFEMPEKFIGESIFSKKHPNSAISKCLGEVFYIDKNIILKEDLLAGISYPVAYFNEFANLKLANYENSFLEVIKKSDKILLENKLYCGAENSNGGLKVDFNQDTDSDKDGLSDLREKALGTDWKDADSDNDGFLDGVEVINGFNPLGEGELKARQLPKGKDSDNDGLSDNEELKYGTDPLNPDSDNDGHFDGSEVIRGYNPLGEGDLKIGE